MAAGRVEAVVRLPGMHGLAGVDGMPVLGTSGGTGVMAGLHVVAEERVELIVDLVNVMIMHFVNLLLEVLMQDGTDEEEQNKSSVEVVIVHM